MPEFFSFVFPEPLPLENSEKRLTLAQVSSTQYTFIDTLYQLTEAHSPSLLAIEKHITLKNVLKQIWDNSIHVNPKLVATIKKEYSTFLEAPHLILFIIQSIIAARFQSTYKKRWLLTQEEQTLYFKESYQRVQFMTHIMNIVSTQVYGPEFMNARTCFIENIFNDLHSLIVNISNILFYQHFDDCTLFVQYWDTIDAMVTDLLKQLAIQSDTDNSIELLKKVYLRGSTLKAVFKCQLALNKPTLTVHEDQNKKILNPFLYSQLEAALKAYYEPHMETLQQDAQYWNSVLEADNQRTLYLQILAHFDDNEIGIIKVSHLLVPEANLTASALNSKTEELKSYTEINDESIQKIGYSLILLGYAYNQNYNESNAIRHSCHLIAQTLHTLIERDKKSPLAYQIKKQLSGYMAKAKMKSEAQEPVTHAIKSEITDNSEIIAEFPSIFFLEDTQKRLGLIASSISQTPFAIIVASLIGMETSLSGMAKPVFTQYNKQHCTLSHFFIDINIQTNQFQNLIQIIIAARAQIIQNHPSIQTESKESQLNYVNNIIDRAMLMLTIAKNNNVLLYSEQLKAERICFLRSIFNDILSALHNIGNGLFSGDFTVENVKLHNIYYKEITHFYLHTSSETHKLPKCATNESFLQILERYGHSLALGFAKYFFAIGNEDRAYECVAQFAQEDSLIAEHKKNLVINHRKRKLYIQLLSFFTPEDNINPGVINSSVTTFSPEILFSFETPNTIEQAFLFLGLGYQQQYTQNIQFATCHSIIEKLLAFFCAEKENGYAATLIHKLHNFKTKMQTRSLEPTLKTRFSQAQERLEALKKKRAILETEHQKLLEAKKNNTQAQFQSIQDKINAIQRLEVQKTELKREKYTQDSLFNKQKQKKDSIEKAFASLSQEYDSLKQQLATKEQALILLQNKIIQLKQSNETRTEDNKKNQAQYDTLLERQAAHKRSLEEYENTLTEYQKQAQTETQTLAQIDEQLHTAQANTATIESRKTAFIKQNEEENTNLQLQLAGLSEQIKHMQAQYTQLCASYENIRIQLAGAYQQITQCDNANQAMHQRWDSNIAGFYETLRFLIGHLQSQCGPQAMPYPMYTASAPHPSTPYPQAVLYSAARPTMPVPMSSYQQPPPGVPTFSPVVNLNIPANTSPYRYHRPAQ